MNTESTSIDNQEEISPSNDSNESLPQENIPPTELQTNNNDEEQTDNPEENTEIYKSEDNKDEEAMKKLASEEGALESSKESSQNDQHKQEVNDDDAYDDADADVDEHSQNYAIKPNEQPKKIIDPELYYNINEYIARPIITEDSGIPENLLNVYHQFGMDVSRRENLQLLKNNILCHIYGNYLQIMNTDTHEKITIRSISGIGIGAFSVHPERKYIAIAEKGEFPYVCIYQYPEIKLYRLLKEGTQAVYSACQFSPDGEMIATVGSDPDYMLTLWEWRSEQIILRAKAFSQDIYRVAWSTDLYGVLTTAGVGHIRFWKMANTFTGLKLQGKLGKFGKVELSDIEGFVTLPDGKVLTGSAWGNLLVWEGELIKVQISRKGKRSCHNGHIMQIVVDEGELLTVGQDGWIRTWDFETIDTAECSEEGALYELEPMNELRVGTKSRLMHIIKIPIPDSTMWYAQDSDGGIWKLDLSFSHTSLAPELLEEFHANDIVDCVTSPFTYCAATVGLDGKVCIYDIVQKQVIVERRFPSSGSSLVWSPPQVDPKGKLLVVGHQDGVLRVLKFGKNPEELTRRTKSSALLDLGQALKPHKMAITSMIYSPSGKMFITGSKDETIFFFNVYPTHLSPIGFVHVHEKVVRLEWFYVNGKATNEIVVYLENGCVITVVCPSENEKYNHSKTFTLSDIQTTRSYQLMSIKSRLDHEEDAEIKLAKYEKEKEARQEIRRMNARLQPETDEEKQKLDDEEEAIRQGVMSEIADWAPTYPSHPSPLLYGCLDRNEPNNFWMSLGEFDKGYLYKCELGGPVLKVDETIEKLRKEKAELKKQNQIKHDIEDKNDAEQCDDKTESNDQESEEESVEVIDSNSLTLADRIIATEPTKAVRIPDTKDTCVTYWTFSNSGYRVLIGFNDGVIRVQLLEKPFDLTSFKGFWMFRLHDNQRGRINRIVLTYDEKFLLSAASDGTLFVCELMTEELQDKEIKEYRARIPSTFDTSKSVDDITDPKAYSIEESKQKSEYDRLLELAEQKKAETRRKLIELRRHFKKLKDKNERLPEKIRLPISEFNLVPEIRNDLFRDRKAEIDLVYRETAWETERNRLALEKLDTAFRKPLDFDRVTVKAFCSAHFVSSIRANKLSEEHLKANYEINKIRQQSLADEAMKQRFTQGDANVNVESEPEKVKSDTEQTQAPVKGARGLRVAQKLHVLEQARQRRAARRAQWEQLQSMKPADNYEDPKDVEAIRLAQEQMGDYKLKSATNYVIPESMKLNTFGAKYRLLSTVEQVFNLRHEFNVSILALRDKKMLILSDLKKIDEQLAKVNCDLPPKEFGIRLHIDELDIEENPEKKFSYDNEILLSFKNQLEEEEKSKRQNEKSYFGAPTTFKKPLSKPLSYTESILPAERYSRGEPTITSEFSENINGMRTTIWFPLHYLTLKHYEILLTNNSYQILPNINLRQDNKFNEISISQPFGSTTTETQQIDQREQIQDINNFVKISIYQPFRPDKVNSCLTTKDINELVDESELIDARKGLSSNLIEKDTNSNENIVLNRSNRNYNTSPLTCLEVEQQKQKYIRAIYQRDMLLTTASRLVRCFDAEVRLLRHTRFKLDVMLKKAEIHQLTLYHEFRLLKEFEKSEHILTEKKKNRTEEKQEICHKVNEVTFKIEQKRKELERLTQREHQIHEEFKASLGDSHKFAEFLTKVFKKRIKRKKQEVFHSGSEESEEESSSDDSSFDESEDESGTEDVNIMDLDTCPPGCPMEDFERTCSIREKRLDIEEEMTEEKKTLEILRKDLETFTKKQRVIETALKQAKNELEAFQLEKQRKLNELEIIVILRLDQIHYYANQTVPSEMTNGLIFLRHTLHALRKRIRELEDEKKQQRVERKQAKTRHIMLQKHKKLFQKELEKLVAICDKEMNDKFGRIDDIEKMESIIVNPKLEDLTTKMLILQEEFDKEESKIEAEIRDARDVCMGQVRQNTVYLTQLLMLFNEHQQLQKELNKTQGSKIGTMHSTSSFVDPKQLKQLVQLIKLQNEEINALTKEIQQLSQ